MCGENEVDLLPVWNSAGNLPIIGTELKRYGESITNIKFTSFLTIAHICKLLVSLQNSYADSNNTITLFYIQMQISMHYVIATAIVFMAEFYHCRDNNYVDDNITGASFDIQRGACKFLKKAKNLYPPVRLKKKITHMMSKKKNYIHAFGDEKQTNKQTNKTHPTPTSKLPWKSNGVPLMHAHLHLNRK